MAQLLRSNHTQARIIFKRNGDTLHEGHTSYQLGKLAGKAQQRVSCVQYFEEVRPSSMRLVDEC